MNSKNKITLGIETSCDETAAAIYHADKGILSNVLFSQADLTKKFGGVMPEIASRSMVEKINKVVTMALEKANVTLDDVDVVAVTNRPGLPGSLLVGLCFAKAIAAAKNIPIIGVNHLEGHAFSSFLEHDGIPFPHLCMTASGGHTALHLIKNFGEYETIGQTYDDAAGEAFDKIARELGYDYPGGPKIEQLAQEIGFQDFHHYPRGKKQTLDFSFSGLKTAVLYDLVKKGFYNLKEKRLLTDDIKIKQQVASSLLVCIADIFEHKVQLALKQYPNIKALSFVGGVACNKYITNRLKTLCESQGIKFYSPSAQYCTDNAAMIAFVGNYKAQKNKFDDLKLDIGRK